MHTDTSRQIAPISNDGIEDLNASDKLIQGEILKNVDGFWSLKDGTTFPPNKKMIALATTMAVQRWQDQTPIEIITKQPGVPLPDVGELNAGIPEKEWEVGLDGKPRPPYQKVWVTYLLDPQDASIYTFLNGTKGAEIAVEKLKERVKWMQTLRGSAVVPVVELSSKPMKTKYGVKQRPEFKVDEWRDLGALQAAPAQPALEHMGKPVKEPSLKEEMGDEVPWDTKGDEVPDLGERHFSSDAAPKKKK